MRKARFLAPWLLGAAALFVLTGGYVGLRLEGLHREFHPPVAFSPQGDLVPRAEYAPLERLGLTGPVHVIEAQADGLMPSSRSSLMGVQHPAFHALALRNGDGSTGHRELLMSSAPSFPALSLDDDCRVVEPPLFQLNPGRIAAEPEQVASAKSFFQGAHLTAVEGRPVETLEDYRAAFNNHRDFLLIRYSLVPSGWEDPVEFVIWKVDWTRVALIYFSGAAIGLLGLLVIYLQPGTYSARGFLLFCIGVALFSFLRSIPPIYRTQTDGWAFSVMMALLPMACAVFLVTFSPLRLVFSRPRVVATALMGWGAALFILNQLDHPGLSYFGGGRSMMLWILTMLGLIVIPFPADYLVRLLGVPVGSMDRQRGKTIRLATLVAFLPLAIQTVYQEITKHHGWVWVDLCTLLFPIIVAFAVLRRGLLVIDEIVLHGLFLVLLLAGMGLIYSGMMGLLSYLALRIDVFGNGSFQGFLLGVLTFSAGGVQLASRRWVSEHLNRLPDDYERLLEGTEGDTLAFIDPLPYCDEMSDSVASVTGGAPVKIFLCTPDRPGHWWLAARTGESLRGPRAGAIAPALDLAAAEKTMIARDVLLDDLNFASRREELTGAFRELGASLLFPMLYESEVWGIMAVGDRPSLKPFRPSEQVALKRVAHQTAGRMREISRRLVLQRHNRGVSRPRIAELYPDFPPRIGDYRIDRSLGSGGMAVVLRGWREGRPYAIKVPNLSVQRDTTMMRRFAHEARTLRRLRHAHIITVDEIGDEAGEPWIAMEYLPMGTLADHLKKEGTLPEDLGRSITRQVALGLAAAQAEDVIHRDIKPRNIFFVSSDTVKVGDFGLAKVGNMTTLTTMPKLLGTPRYIAPEIWENKGADWASDQYALGVTFYELLVGETPFQTDSMISLLKSHIFMPPPDIRTRDESISDPTAAVVNRMLAKDPEDRFRSYAELVAALA